MWHTECERFREARQQEGKGISIHATSTIFNIELFMLCLGVGSYKTCDQALPQQGPESEQEQLFKLTFM